MSYQRVVISEFGGPEVLKLIEEQQLPEPAAGQVRVKVLAAGTGFTDTVVRRGNYIAVKDKPPFTPGYDYVGRIDKLGEGVEGLQVGQWVADMPVIGGYAQYIVRDAKYLVPIPAGIDPVEAVCMPLSFQTAYQMYTRFRRFSPGQRVLLHGASGATGTALLALGKHFGLEMYGTCSAQKFPLLERFGCTPIDYRNEDFESRIRELTGDGVDAVFDALGGAHWDRSFRCLRRGGILIGYGAQNIVKNQDSLPRVLWGFFKLNVLWKVLPNGRDTGFYNIHARREQLPQEFTEDLLALFELLRQRCIVPVVAGTYPLSEVRTVHEKIDNGVVEGKIVLLPFPA